MLRLHLHLKERLSTTMGCLEASAHTLGEQQVLTKALSVPDQVRMDLSACQLMAAAMLFYIGVPSTDTQGGISGLDHVGQVFWMSCAAAQINSAASPLWLHLYVSVAP